MKHKIIIMDLSEEFDDMIRINDKLFRELGK